MIRAANLDDMEPRIERWGMFNVDRRKYDISYVYPDGARIVLVEKSLAIPVVNNLGLKILALSTFMV